VTTLLTLGDIRELVERHLPAEWRSISTQYRIDGFPRAANAGVAMLHRRKFRTLSYNAEQYCVIAWRGAAEWPTSPSYRSLCTTRIRASASPRRNLGGKDF
jgi:hypothetical protein